MRGASIKTILGNNEVKRLFLKLDVLSIHQEDYKEKKFCSLEYCGSLIIDSTTQEKTLKNGEGLSMNTLAAYNVKKNYIQGNNIIHVLNGVSAQFRQGISYAITGPSGSGKSTLIHLLSGLDVPAQGIISFNAVDINALTSIEKKAFLTTSLGLVFQLPYLISEFSVLENVMLKGIIAGNSIESLKEQAYILLDNVKLSHKASSSPLSLSGGEQQRVALARALFNKPAFLLADEPTGNLDVATGKVIVELLLLCQAQWGMGIIVSSHDAYVCERMANVLRLENGILI